MAILTPESRSNDPEGSIALRDFFNELFEERAAAMNRSSSLDSDSVSLSSDEETANSADNLITSRDNSRRHRHRGRKPQRSRIISVSPDNAAGFRRQSRTKLVISSYHNPLNKSGHNACRKYSLSASAHSLGSRTGISSTSVGNWRSSLHKHRKTLSRQEARKNHKDSRWSTSPLDIPNNSRSSRVKQYDFGFVNDSMHVRNIRRSKKNQRKATKQSVNTNTSIRRNARKTSCSKAIDSAVRVLSTMSSSDDESTDGEEFFEDEESLSSFTDSFVSSQANVTINSTKTIGSSLDFGSRYKTKAKALTASPRVVPSRTKSGGDLPRMPRRTKDDSSFKLEELFEPLKGNSSSHHTSFRKKQVRRSLSDDVSIMSRRSKRFENAKRRITDSFGRWAATITNKKDEAPKNDSTLRLPRRIPSLSSRSNDSNKKPGSRKFHKGSNSSSKSSEGTTLLKASNRSTGRYSNHSNDSSEPSDSDSEGSSVFHNSFAYDDDSLTATMATTESSAKGSNTNSSASSSHHQDEAFEFLFKPVSSHSRRLAIPESLRKLPLNSFHGSSISSKTSVRAKHPGKRLRTASIGKC